VNNATVRQAAAKFGISKSTVHKDVTEKLKQENKELYFDAVHRAYLGDRISKRLQINDSAVKGCSYYYKLAAQSGMQSEDFSLPDSFRSFPDELNTLIEECIRGEYGSKEACVVLTCDLIISRIRQAQAANQDRDIPYEKLIKDIFDTMMEVIGKDSPLYLYKIYMDRFCKVQNITDEGIPVINAVLERQCRRFPKSTFVKAEECPYFDIAHPNYGIFFRDNGHYLGKTQQWFAERFFEEVRASFL